MSRVTAHLVFLVWFLVLGAAPVLCAADDCAAGPAGELIQRSTFAHGYLHGYEAGFRAGDADFHIARVRSLRERREISRPSGYLPEFGSRESFRGGFREGFQAGYEDSVAGRDFRAFEIPVASALSGPAGSRDFDRGFEDGYKAGQTGGAGDLDTDSDFDPSKAACPAKPASDGRLPESSQAYCAGYVSAYGLGYTDGYLLASPAGSSEMAAAR